MLQILIAEYSYRTIGMKLHCLVLENSLDGPINTQNPQTRLLPLTKAFHYKPESIWSTTVLLVNVAQSLHVCAIILGICSLAMSAGLSSTVTYNPPLTCHAIWQCNGHALHSLHQHELSNVTSVVYSPRIVSCQLQNQIPTPGNQLDIPPLRIRRIHHRTIPCPLPNILHKHVMTM